MDNSRWMLLKGLFRQAYDLPTQERDAFLEQQCGDAGMRREVQALLAEQECEPATADSFGNGDAPRMPQPTVEGVGSWISAYRLLERIGEGGFGTVFMAEQEQPVRRRVALKIIKPGMDSREVVARFEQERQALALMDHPHIARVFDAGATDNGRPFVVMELVRGVPLTEFCDTQNLSIRNRLELFCLVCDAVQHAHQKGVIHRDLKPSNLLVGQVDGRPNPKVIDFGIAKALRERLTDKTLFTRFQQMVGTPQYMSPEQVDGNLDIDTRSDVYSLGVVLYELLTGTPPLDVRRLDSLHEIQRIIKEVDPPKPSTRLGVLRGQGEKLARVMDHQGDDSRLAGLPDAAMPARMRASSVIDIARSRHTDAGSLMKQLRGEPDWIVMRALEKDRARRYESAAALGADVRRYLANEPVVAGPPGRWYRARKLVRRHRAAFISAVAVFSVLLAGAVGSSVGLLRASAALRREQIAARTAQQVQAVLEHALIQANPYDTVAVDPSVRALLDRTSASLETELANQPDVEASVRVTMSMAYRGLGANTEAIREAQRVIDISRHADVRRVLIGEASHVIGRARLSALQFAMAAAPLDDAVRHFEAAATDGDHLGQALMARGDLNLQTGNLPAAAVDFDRAESVILAASPPDETLMSVLLVFRGRLFERKGEYDRATQAYEQSLAIQRPLANADSLQEMNLCSPLSGIGSICMVRGDHACAIAAIAEVVEIMQRRLGMAHPEVATALGNLAAVERGAGDMDAAEKHARQALRIRQKALGADHPMMIYSLSQLGTIASGRGDYKEAARLFSRAVDGRRRSIGETDAQLSTELTNLASALAAMGELERAEGYSTEALEVARRMFGNEHPRTLDAMGELATQLTARRKFREAEPLIREALAGNRRHFGDKHMQVARDLGSLALTLHELGHTSEAEQAYRESISLARELMGPDYPELATPICNMCVMLNDDGRSAEAEPLLREALRIVELKHKADSPLRWRALLGLGVALTKTGRAAEAEPLMRQVLAARVESLAADSPVLAHTRGALGECLAELHQFDEAESLLIQTQSFFASLRGRAHRHTLEQDRRLIRLYTLADRPSELRRWQGEFDAASSQPASRLAE